MSAEHKGESPAGRAMDEAIELDLQGRSPYPKRASFIDADTPHVGRAINRAVASGMAVVLVSADGSWITLRAEPPYSPGVRFSALRERVGAAVRALSGREPEPVSRPEPAWRRALRA